MRCLSALCREDWFIGTPNSQLRRSPYCESASLGFDSFDHVLTGKDAVVIAKMRPPDLVLIGDSPESGDVLGAARQICETYDTPVLIVAASQAKRP